MRTQEEIWTTYFNQPNRAKMEVLLDIRQLLAGLYIMKGAQLCGGEIAFDDMKALENLSKIARGE